MAYILPSISQAALQPFWIRVYAAVPQPSGGELILMPARRTAILAVEAGALEGRAPKTGILRQIDVWTGANLSGGAAKFDVNLNGTTVFPLPANRISIASGAQYGTANVSVAVTVGDLLTVDVDELPAAGISAPLIARFVFE